MQTTMTGISRRLRTVAALMVILALSRLALNFLGPKGHTYPLVIKVRQYSARSPVESLKTDDGDDVSIRPKTGHFRILTAGLCKKKDGSTAKYGNCGEDSYFIALGDESDPLKKSLLAVADGVGGWADHGGDSSQVSNGFMASMKRLHLASDRWYGLPSLIKNSFDYLITLRTVSKGTTTICSAAFDHETGELEVSNIGDSQLVVLRDGKVILEVEAGVWAFNSPNQIGFGLYGEPQGDVDELNIEKRIKLSKGDIIILGTDGLFDNVYVEEIASIASGAIQKDKGVEGISKAAKLLVRKAYNNGLDSNYLSPFAKEAIEAGKAPGHYRGGKPDDISIIVAVIS